MNRIAVAVVAVALAVPIIAQTDPPAKQDPQPQPAAVSKQKDPTADPGVRKLSRRERKDRIKNLSEKYQQFLEDVEPIIMPQERDTFLILETDAQRDAWIIEFWRRRDKAAGTTNNSFHDVYYARVEEAREKFKHLSNDRAHMFLLQGPPNEIVVPNCGTMLQPIEIWKYFYIPNFGHDVRFLFYVPRRQNDYRLWAPITGDEALAELVSQDVEATSPTTDPATLANSVFNSRASGSFNLTNLQVYCGTTYDELMRAIAQSQLNSTDLVTKVWDPPPVDPESMHNTLRSVVIANPNAPKMPAEMKVEYPAKQGSRTDAQITVLIPRDKATATDVSGSSVYSFDVTGEVLKEDQMFENFRYRFDFPADTKLDKFPLVIDRLLRPNTYKARVRVTDVHSGAEAIVENKLEVPEIFESAVAKQQKAEATAQLTTIKDVMESNETSLRIVPLTEDLLSGFQHIETIAFGDKIKGVEFYLDGRKVMTKRQPPYDLDLDFGDVPRAHNVRAVALDDKGQIITGDEVVVNTGTDPFRVRIVSPRVAMNLHGQTKVEMSVRTPEGKHLDKLQLYYNETPVATLYGPPYVQTINIPQNTGVAYLRAVASLKDDPTPPIEDVVMINTPQFMEEVNVHLVELPTTVIANGHPINSLAESAFKVMDEGKPVKIAKFEHVANLPLSIGMAVDTSGSMQPRMSEAQRSGAEFFKNVLKAGDKAFLVSFDTQPQLIQKWTTKLGDLDAGLSKLRAEESTALYDAVVYSLYNFLGVKGQKALVVITDGADTSSKFSWDQAIEYSRRAAVPIYAIAIGMRPTDIDVKYKLAKFCSETGGNMYQIENASQLGAIYRDIQNELRSQYVLGFYPPDGVKPGSKWHEVSVQVSEGRAKTIHGYYP
ncbi:MAG TPA: VWA domain-containing protein [Thermoanaerobaculia bacterium]|jgi:Ca-activated chloride channel family protein|nr:VWA domain-containing protein [Thermoanaerobaculia bacterium]